MYGTHAGLGGPAPAPCESGRVVVAAVALQGFAVRPCPALLFMPRPAERELPLDRLAWCTRWSPTMQVPLLASLTNAVTSVSIVSRAGIP